MVLLVSLLAAANTDFLRADDRTPLPVNQANDGSVTLTAPLAKISGPNARLEGGDETDIIWWTHRDTSLHWIANISKPGVYRVELIYSIVGQNNGSALSISVGAQSLKVIPKASAGFSVCQTGNAGEITVGKAGNLQVVLKPLAMSHEFVMTLRAVVLLPGDAPTQAIDISGNPIPQLADGSFKLAAEDADIDGRNAILEGSVERNIGYWNDVETGLLWTINVRQPGNYRVELNYALTESNAGSKVTVTVGDQTVKAKPKAAGTWTDYKVGCAGEVSIHDSGNLQVLLKPVSKPGGYVLNLRSVALLPVDFPARAPDIGDVAIEQSADGSFQLTPAAAEIDGRAARLEGMEENFLVWWNSLKTPIKWPVRVNKPGWFNVRLLYSMENETAGAEIEFDAGERKVAATLEEGSGLDDYKSTEFGEILIEKAGDLDLVLKSTKEPGGLMMNVKSVYLIPITKE